MELDENLKNAFRIYRDLTSTDNNQKKLQLLRELYRTLKLFQGQSIYLQKFAKSATVMVFKRFLMDTRSQVRLKIIQILKLVLIRPQVCSIFKSQHIPLYIARSLQRQIKQDKEIQTQREGVRQEQASALRFIRKWIEIDGQNFPKLMANSLVSYASQPNLESQRIRAAVQTIKELAEKNHKICAWSGGFKILIEALTNPLLQEMNSRLMSFLLIVLNDPLTRKAIGCYLDFSLLFYQFSNIDIDFTDKLKLQKQQKQLKLSKRAIISILKSWQGLIYLGKQKNCLISLIQSLRQQISPMVRQAIFQILDQLLDLSRLLSDGTTNNSFVQGILKCYLVILVQLLLDCNVFKILVELSGLQDPQKSVPAQRFLKQLTTIMFNTIPNSGKYTDFLISAASQNDPQLQILKSCTKSVVNTMGNYSFDVQKKDKSPRRFVIAVENLLLNNACGVPCYRTHNETINKLRSISLQETSESKFNNCLRGCLVQQKQQNWQKWNFDLIREALDHYFLQGFGFQENGCKFLKKLIKFYLPSKKLCSLLPFKQENFNLFKVGYLLVKTLLANKRGQAFLIEIMQNYDAQRGFVPDLLHCLKSYCKDESFSDLFSYGSFQTRGISQIVSWLGLFTQNQVGLQILQKNRIFQVMSDMIADRGKYDHILRTLFYSFDQSEAVPGKIHLQLFQKGLFQGSSYLSLSCIQLMRLCLKLQIQHYKGWAVRQLSQLVHRQGVGRRALQVLQQIFEDQESQTSVLLEQFVKNKFDLQKLSAHDTFLPSLLSHPEGFRFLKENCWLEQYFEKYYYQTNLQFVLKLQKEQSQILSRTNLERAVYQLDIGLSNIPLFGYNFLFKIPWRILIEVTNNSSGYLQECQNILPLFTSSSLLSIQSKFKPVTLKENTILSFYLMIGSVFVDNLCDVVQTPFKIIFTAKDRKKYDQAGFFNKLGWRLRLNEDSVSQVELHLRIYEQITNKRLPNNSFRNLAQTHEGIQFIRENSWIQRLIMDLSHSDIMKVRQSLWTLGNIGSTKLGVQLLRQKKAFEKILRMGQSQGHLSVRGTCIYIVNLFSFSHKGRSELQKNGWLVHWNNNMGWICMPKDTSLLFRIDEMQNFSQQYWPLQKQPWGRYEKFIESIKIEDQAKNLLSNIGLLAYQQTVKSAINQITRIGKSSSWVFKDQTVFMATMMTIIFYDFPFEVRRLIFNKFEEFFRNSPISQQLDKPEWQCLYET